VTLPNGGKSKASQSKQRQTLGAIINGMSKALAKDKATPARYRAEGIENAMKRARFLPTKKEEENKTCKLQLLDDVLKIRILTNYLLPFLIATAKQADQSTSYAAGQASPSLQEPPCPPNNENCRVSFCLPVAPLLLLATPSCQPPSTDRQCESPCCAATLLFQTPTPAKRARTESANSAALQTEEPASDTNDDSCDEIMETTTVDELLKQAGRKKSEKRAGKRVVKRGRGPYINAAKVAKIRRDIGDFNLQLLKRIKKPELRRHVMAIAADAKRKEIEDATGIKISGAEYTEIKLHARFPGPMKRVEKETFGRQRISNKVIIALLHSLESGGKLQRNAFGTKVIEILGGLEHVTTENIERNQKVCQIAARFVVELCDEASTEIANGELLVPEERCKRTERDSARRCLSEAAHAGNCKFTPPGSVSMTKASELIKILSGDDIKKLSGLDDIKVEQGREHFLNLRRIIDSLFTVEEAHCMKKRVDNVENFYKTDFKKHLEATSEHSCACLTCGFFDTGK
jgi:hypothetical protein